MAIDFPASPTNGQKFTNGNVVYTYSTAAGRWETAPLGTALPFNYFVNAAAQISQQNGRNSGTATGFYLADQWKFEWVHASGKTSFGISSTQNNYSYGVGATGLLNISTSSIM